MSQGVNSTSSSLKELCLNDETSELFNATLHCWYFFPSHVLVQSACAMSATNSEMWPRRPNTAFSHGSEGGRWICVIVPFTVLSKYLWIRVVILIHKEQWFSLCDPDLKLYNLISSQLWSVVAPDFYLVPFSRSSRVVFSVNKKCLHNSCLLDGIVYCVPSW